MENDKYSTWKANTCNNFKNDNRTAFLLSPSETETGYCYEKPDYSRRCNDVDDFHETICYSTNYRCNIKSPYYNKRRYSNNTQGAYQRHQCQLKKLKSSESILSKNYQSEPMFDSLPCRSPFRNEIESDYDGSNNQRFISWDQNDTGRVHGSSYRQPYIPPNAHVPVNRYVPKTEPYVDVKYQQSILYPANEYSYSLTKIGLQNTSLPLKFSEKETQCNLMKQSIIVSFASDNIQPATILKNAIKTEFITDNDQVTAICWKPGQCTESPLKQAEKLSYEQVNNNGLENNLAIKRTLSEPSTSTSILTPQQNLHTFLTQSQSDMLSSRSKRVNRTNSITETIRNFLKKETTSFFGIDIQTENEQQSLWLEKRKRFALRKYGPLKFEFRLTPEEIEFDQLDCNFKDTEIVSAVADCTNNDMRPDVLPMSVNDDINSFNQKLFMTKCSVFYLIISGLSILITALFRHKKRKRLESPELSRSYHPEIVPTTRNISDSNFFEASSMYLDTQQFDQIDISTTTTTSSAYLQRERIGGETKKFSWQRIPKKTLTDQRKLQVGGNRILSSIIDRVDDNSNRRQYGKGWISTIFRRSFKRSIINNEHVRKQLDDLEDHRPFFTYWITIVQILILIISLFSYGFGPFGINMSKKSGHVLVNSLSLQQVDYQEPSNFWIGPRAADLIHLGAKFSPCMRLDSKINHEIMIARKRESETACCIRNDDSGCVQAYRNDCSFILSYWHKWTTPGNRISGSVCGLDPKYCDAPASVHPYEWPDDITKWPICKKNSVDVQQRSSQVKDKAAEHMVCDVIGRPCCIGIHGLCQITTKEYCDFVNGYFHEEAALCSQVSCLNDVCGLISFYSPDIPDQLYRLISSIFLHAGILHLCVTILVQYYLMRDLEKLTGSFRLSIIYFGSGIAGNLASSIFLPYRADVGPSGSQFGLLACLIVEVIHAWPMLRCPKSALVKLLIITLILLVLGTMPWVDNYAHLFGFLFGFLLSYAFLPFITFGKYDRRKKIILITVCLLIATALFIVMLILFYFFSIQNCPFCSYLNCLPITRDFCASQNIDIVFEQMRI